MLNGAPLPSSVLALVSTVHLALAALRHHRLPSGKFPAALVPPLVLCASPWLFPTPAEAVVGAVAHLVWFLVCGWMVPTPAPGTRRDARAEVPRSAGVVGAGAAPLGRGGEFVSVPVIAMFEESPSINTIRLARFGTMAAWLDVHIFCGIVGPVLVTFHTSFRFNGAISVAYWSIVLVMLSGFVGRYLYVRIPRSIRGAELSREEIEARMSALAARIDDRLVVRVMGTDVVKWGGRRRARRALVTGGVSAALARDVAATLAERAWLSRRLHRLQRTKRWFAAWHVFHQPLVSVVFAIAVVHVAVVMYLGYSFY